MPLPCSSCRHMPVYTSDWTWRDRRASCRADADMRDDPFQVVGIVFVTQYAVALNDRAAKMSSAAMKSLRCTIYSVSFRVSSVLY